MVRLGLIGSLLILFASLFAIIQRDILSEGLAGLSISYSLTVCNTKNYIILYIKNQI